METETQQARESLRVISRAEAAARMNGPNNGTVPLVWGAVVLVGLTVYDLVPALIASALVAALAASAFDLVAAVAASAWTMSYQRHLPVKPLKVEKPWLFGAWSFYHLAVLMGGIALGTDFWHTDHARPGTATLIGLLDSAPLLYVGWSQRRQARAVRP